MSENVGFGPFPFDIQTDDLLTLEQLADKFSVSKSKLEKTPVEEMPPFIKPFGKKLFPRQGINKWIIEFHPELWDMMNPSAEALKAVQGAK